jgi:hypothetical protein
MNKISPQEKERFELLMDKDCKRYEVEMFVKDGQLRIYQNVREIHNYEKLGMLRAASAIIEREMIAGVTPIYEIKEAPNA